MADGADSGGGGGGDEERSVPLTTFLWAVKIDEMEIDSQAEPAMALFTSCTGLKFERPVTDYHEGGQKNFTHKMAGAIKWSNITLTRGFSGDRKFFDWKVNPCRREILIMHLGDGLQPVTTYKVKGCWPVKWKGTNYDASKNETGIETIEIAHEGLEIV
jgi:phage tail-like protein